MSNHHLTRSAVFILLEKEGKYLFLRRKYTGWNDGKLTLPSGHIDQGEGVRRAGAREAEEEVGIIINETDLEFIHAHYCLDTYTNFYFKAIKWDGEPVLNEPHLASELVWLSENEIDNDVIFHVRKMLESYKKHEYFSDVPNDFGDGSRDEK
jgi:8-oxo-dGTP diphosphatase